MIAIMIGLMSAECVWGFEYTGSVTSWQKTDQYIEFNLSNGLFRLYPLESGVYRFRYARKSFSSVPSYAVIKTQEKWSDFTFQEYEDHFLLSDHFLTIRVTKSPCRIRISDKQGRIINQDDDFLGVAFDEDEVRCFKTLYPNENFYGLGEKTGELNKRGNHYTMWNTDFPAYSFTHDPLYVSIPFLIGIRDQQAYGIFFDNTYKSTFNLGAGSSRFYWFGAEKGEMDYYFIYGPEIKTIIKSYTNLTGKIPMPPMWALGYQQSKWSYYPDETVTALAAKFRQRNIPCDVLYLDIHYMDGYRVFTWDPLRFPDPKKLTDELADQGFKLITIIDPGVKADSHYTAAKEGLEQNLFATYPDGEVYQGEVWPSWAYFPDFTNPATRDWWGNKLNGLIQQGVDGFWNDMNEPAVWGQSFPDMVRFNGNGYPTNHKQIHNVYGLEMARATMDGIRKHSQQRHLVVTRAGYAGIQRYAAVWTGDNVSSEDHLRLACLMPQGMGLSGLAYTGSDVGGFIGVPSPALYVRWMQLGVFTPFFRGHSAVNQQDKEPWAFGDYIEDIVRRTILMRYNYIPFLYNEFHQSHLTGLPIMRPLFLNFQYDPECYTSKAQYQFMVGENLLVAPVVSEKENFKEIYLPEGQWLDLNSFKVYPGNQWISQAVPLDKIPLFLKAGGIIARQSSQNYIGERKLDTLEFHIYPASASDYELYQDDGQSYAYENGTYSLTRIKVEQNKTTTIQVTEPYHQYDTGRKYYQFNVFYAQSPHRITVKNNQNSVVLREDDLKQGFRYDSRSRVICLTIPAGQDSEIQIR